MRSFVALGGAGLVAMVIQTTVFPSLPRLPVVPDLILVLTVYVGLRHHGIGGAMGAFLFGYFVDTFSGTVLGANAFALTAVYAGVAVVARNLWIEGGLPAMAMVFLGALGRQVAAAAVGMVVAGPAPIWQHVLRHGLLEAAAAALVTPPVFGFVAWEKRLLGLG